MKIPNPFYRPPAPPGFGGESVVPEESASPLSRLFFHWLTPFLDVGYTRPLQKDDLWQLPTTRHTQPLTTKLEANFYARCPPDKRPRFLRPSQDTDSQNDSDSEKKKRFGFAQRTRKEPKYDSSLLKAIHQTFFWRWWLAGILKLLSDTLKTTTPLLTKVILNWLTQSFQFRQAPNSVPQPRGIGYGIGLAFALFAMQEVASLLTNHFMQLSMTNGIFVRTSIIGNVFRKSLRLSGRARLAHSVGQITTMISADASRFDRFSLYVHNIWVAPIQICIVIGLLIGNLGVSALVGLAVILLGFPIQILLAKVMFMQRKKGIRITDSRVRLTGEVLQGIRLLRFYAWESFYAQQIGDVRSREVRTLGRLAFARSVLIAIVTFIPVLASVLAFITYALTGHDLNVGIIFSSLQLFNIIRTPLNILPLLLAFTSDVLVSMARVSTFLVAEELEDPYTVEYESKNAVQVHADFAWETVGKTEGPKFQVPKVGKGQQNDAKRKAPKSGDAILPQTNHDTVAANKDNEKPFELKGLDIAIPKGSFIAIVGRVGSGKSSILQALIGEMRKIRGEVIFGGSVAYVPQNAWIRNATVRENIVFGSKDDDERFWDVVRACSLEHDLKMLPYGEHTEIGEKGINLSGGQKARVSLARAAYSASEIILLDDPLSAVDAYVGKAILDRCFLTGPLADKTRILVTHSLHVLDKTDYIYVVDNIDNNGAIVERGTYQDLMKQGNVFCRLMEEYGSLEQAESQEPKKDQMQDVTTKADAQAKQQDTLMQEEERFTGSVSWSTYAGYLRFGGGIVWAPLILLILTLMQSAQVGNNLLLGFWTDESIPGFREGQYMALYAGLGLAQAVFAFALSLCIVFGNLRASTNLFKSALNHVLRSPIAFFDTTPVGRIMSRLSKDQDTLDIDLALTLNTFLTTFSSVLGTVALIFYTFPYLGIIFAPMTVLYLIVSTFYRRTSVETKRLDSLMRSQLYSSFSESLTGLATIRAYRIQERATTEADSGLNMENRAYYMTVSIQRWLSIRLDLFGNILVLGIALFAAGFRQTVNPAKVGVVLSYTLSITQVFSDLVSQFAQNEQNMNAVERVLVYSKLTPEGESTTKNDPPLSWPSAGKIEFSDVYFSYRPGLPSVLTGITFTVNSGEKVGVVGRTGAGKSSLLQALFRIVELQSGKIEIDGLNLRNMGLDTLRSRLAIVPQDGTLFSGTLRENLDPQNSRTDAEIISVLQRAWLLPRDNTKDPAAEAKFSLDSTVSDEGSNFSAGEKQLLSLCRALVKNSKIIILDEATSAVDVETDAKLQRTIQTEFASSTLLCIAHRLNTIAYYDRILVVDAGQIAEYDTVLNLFDKSTSIFRSLCDEANLTRTDIMRIREEHEKNIDATL